MTYERCSNVRRGVGSIKRLNTVEDVAKVGVLLASDTAAASPAR